jgi:hypothetical protein
MSQININPSDSGDRTAAAGLNMVTVLLVLVVLVILGWFLLAGPLRGTFGGGTYNPNQPVPQVTAAPNANPPAEPQAKPTAQP